MHLAPVKVSARPAFWPATGGSFGNLALATGVAAALVWQSANGTIVPWVVLVDQFGAAQSVAPAIADYRPTDPQIAWHLARVVNSGSIRPGIPI